MLPLADTTFEYCIDFPKDTTYRLIYVGTGDCSICIASILDFLKEYSFTKDKLPLLILLKSDNAELFNYFREKNKMIFANENSSEIMNLPVILTSPTANAKDGMYLLCGNRISKYSAWRCD